MERTAVNTEFASAFKSRTRKHAVSTVLCLKPIKSNDELYVIKNQLIKSATSVPANYRAACTAKSKVEFISKPGIVHEEDEEKVFCFETLNNLNYRGAEIGVLCSESEEILKIVAKSVSTSRANYNSKMRN